MTSSYQNATQDFKTIIDFIRFGVSEANSHHLYFGHGTDNAWDDIQTLTLESLSLPLDIEPLFLHGRLTSDEKSCLSQQLFKRIHGRIPVPYLIHKAWFCGLSFYVDERVLIPRSPIAELINQQFSPWIEETRVERILDLCTGSACIAIACSYAFPDAIIDAVDISVDALDVAQINRENYEMQDCLTLIESNCFDALPPVRYDIIVSNPPYVGQEEMQRLPDEYHHEPKLALETENNGLAIVERILYSARDFLTEHGILVVEVGNSEEALINAYPHVPFTWLEFEHGGHGVFVLTYNQLQEHFAGENG